MRPRGERGASLAEALAAAGLAGLALAGVALGAQIAGASLRIARDTSTALALAESRLEALRAGPRGDGGDEVTAEGVAFRRTWRVAGGRGRVSRAAVDVVWPQRRVALETGMLP